MCSRIRGSSWNTFTRPKLKRPVPKSSATRWRLVVSRTRCVQFILYFTPSLSPQAARERRQNRIEQKRANLFGEDTEPAAKEEE
jgi:hypothetical protein